VDLEKFNKDLEMLLKKYAKRFEALEEKISKDLRPRFFAGLLDSKS